jgi:hypothetical protein
MSNICREGWSRPKWSTLLGSVLSFGSWPCPQLLDRLGLTDSFKHTSLLRNGFNYDRKSFIEHANVIVKIKSDQILPKFYRDSFIFKKALAFL